MVGFIYEVVYWGGVLGYGGGMVCRFMMISRNLCLMAGTATFVTR